MTPERALHPADNGGYRLFVSDDRCTMVHFWNSGVVEVARRDSTAHTWGPPERLTEERV